MEDFELNDSDLQIDNEAINQARIDQLYREINQLRAQLNVPPGIQQAIGGMGIGYGLGLGSLGSVAMGFLGYQLGKGKELNDKQKQQIQAQIQLKARELLSMERGEQVEQAKISGVMSADELVEYKYDSYPFDGKWKNLIGNPAKSFHMMVFGRPKQGKSIFCFQLAKYLSKFGKVLYIASEEGFSATLQQKLQEFGAINPNLYFANYRDYETIKQNITGQDYEFIIIL
jgi:hypothetical protein